MNARQKAKYYKRKYENLLKQPFPYTVDHRRIDTLQFVQSFPAYLIEKENGNTAREIVKSRIAHYLAENMDKYIDYRTIYNPMVEEYQVYGRLQVVVNLYNKEG